MEIMIFPGPRERRVAELLAVEGMCAAGSVTGGGREWWLVELEALRGSHAVN